MQVTARLGAFGIKLTTAAKNIGYELRCADPTPFDMEYTRDLGYCAAKYLLAGGNAAMISIQGGHFVPVPFGQMIDGETGRTRIRLVDVTSTRYAIARRYMIRLRRDDFEDPHELAKLAATAHISPEEFRREFEYLIASEPPPFAMDKLGERVAPPDRADARATPDVELQNPLQSSEIRYKKASRAEPLERRRVRAQGCVIASRPSNSDSWMEPRNPVP